jgi:hypothetical protein
VTLAAVLSSGVWRPVATQSISSASTSLLRYLLRQQMFITTEQKFVAAEQKFVNNEQKFAAAEEVSVLSF